MSADRNDWLRDACSLEGSVAIVTGGGEGLGEAIAGTLSAAGASVAIVDASADAAAQVAERLTRSGSTACSVACRFEDENSCTDAVAEVERGSGRVDILVNAAGGMSSYARRRPTHEWTTDDWDLIFQVNLRQAFWMCRSVLPGFIDRGGGTIVNVTSIAASFGSPNQAAYGAARAGQVNLTKTLAVEYGRHHVRVNAVSPGIALTAGAYQRMDAATRERYRALTPLRALGTPEDVGGAVLFLTSGLAGHITGQDLVVDGGIGVNFPYPDLA